MQPFFWFLAWLALFMSWYTPVVPVESAQAPAAVETTVQTTVEAPMDEPFGLDYGAAAVLDDGELTIMFDSVVEDSRCPTDVMCAWSGQAIVRLRVEAAGEAAQTVELGGFTDYEGVLRPQRPELETVPSATVGGYKIELLAVTPYPAHNATPPAPEEYQVQLQVSAGE